MTPLDVARNNLPHFPCRIRARCFVAIRLCGLATRRVLRLTSHPDSSGQTGELFLATSFVHETETNTDQIVAVFDSDSGRLKGVVIGGQLGAIRTAAICGLALDLLAPKSVNTLLVIGAGHQAHFQVASALAVRRVDRIQICGRNPARAAHLAERVEQDFGVCTTVSTDVEQCVRAADIVLCATNSASPVLEKKWLKENVFISSIGPKFAEAHELPTDIGGGNAILASDALVQLASYTTPYFLPSLDGVIPLEDLLAPHVDLTKACHRVFLCGGRSGTEVAVANQAFGTS